MTLAELGEFAQRELLNYHVDDQVLAAYRVALGFILFFESIRLWKHGPDIFGRDGMLPLETYKSYYKFKRINIFLFFGNSREWVRFLFVLQSVLALCLAAGFLTNLVAFLLFLNFIGRINRNHVVCHGGDLIAKFALLLLTFSRAGAVYSVDQRLGIEVLAAESDWPVRLIQFQTAIVYWKTLLWKFNCETWIRGDAVWTSIQHSLHSRYSERTLGFLRVKWIRKTLTYATLLVEAAIPVCLMVNDLRLVGVFLMFALHFGIELILSMKVFGWLMMVQAILFL